MYRTWAHKNKYVYSGVAAIGIAVLWVMIMSTAVSARQPYVRTYGNDVVAGGGYGPGCAPADEDVLGYGAFLSPSNEHDSYVGSGSELGVFASGSIEGFLPGIAVNTARSAPWELSFANTDAAKKTPPFGFGGGHNNLQCVEEFPDTTGFINLRAHLLSRGLPDDDINLDWLDSGEYIYRGARTLHVEESVLTRNQRITIVVDRNPANPMVDEGELTIQGNITYADTSWDGTDEIPLIKMYARGNLKIDHEVEIVTGLYHVGGNGTGAIWTCTERSRIVVPSNDPADIPPGGHGLDVFADICNDRRLTVYGALVGDRTNFYRTINDITDGGVGESHGSVGNSGTAINAAETIIFSPEIYLGLLDEEQNTATTTISVDAIDSIRSLPPAF